MCNKYSVCVVQCKNVDWNKLGALLSGKMLQTVKCTNNIDVDLDWECCSSAMMMLLKHVYPKLP